MYTELVQLKALLRRMEAHSAALEERYDSHITQSSAQIAQLQSELAAAKHSAAAATAEAQELPTQSIQLSLSTSTTLYCIGMLCMSRLAVPDAQSTCLRLTPSAHNASLTEMCAVVVAAVSVDAVAVATVFEHQLQLLMLTCNLCAHCYQNCAGAETGA
jgi:hypothetical protein